MIHTQPKKKYRIGKQYRRTPYRTRTGPLCCSVNCPARKKPYLTSGIAKERK